MKRVFFLIVFVGFAYLSLNAQSKVKEVKITEVRGVAFGSNMESVGQVSQRAVNEAKIKALKQAGVAENITSFTDYFQSEDNGKYDELFTSDVLSDIRGAVKNVEILDTRKSFDEVDRLKVEVLINCTVVKYLTEKDLTFDVWVDGVRMFYENETELEFAVKPSKNTFVKIFIFSESEAFQLFPSEYEASYMLMANQENGFPSETMEYTLFTHKKSEVHRMIMVFMKEDIPYTNDVEYKKIIDWIFSIPPDMRLIKSFGFSVVQNEKVKS